MSDNHSEEQHIGIPGYLGVFTVLIVGTVATYYVATIDLDWVFPGQIRWSRCLSRLQK